jgi:alanine racemase
MKDSPTVLEINASALIHNLQYFKTIIKKKTKIIAVIKAFGYGSDAVEIANIIKNDVAYLAVAYVGEGITLRKAGIDTPILVLHPQIPNLNNLLKYNLEPNLYSETILNAFLTIVDSKNLSNYPIHLKFNTGLNRLGFKETDIEFITSKLKGKGSIVIKSIFSHLVASEDKTERDYSLNQIAKFKKIGLDFIAHFGFKPMMHMTNTSGIINYPQAQFDMVRLGIGLYGLANDCEETSKLKNVLSLKSIISQIHKVERGESVGYNRGFIASNNLRSATIPIGHADGICRRLGNGNGYVRIQNKKSPIIGNVCMDMIMVDISNIDCKEGDEVIIFDDQKTIEEFAQNSDTISYELLTAISQRVRRKIVNIG